MRTLSICLLLLAPLVAQADDPESLPLLGGLPGGTEHAVVVGNHAYCATYSGLLVLDVADIDDMFQVALLPLEGWGCRVAVADGHAYVLSFHGDLTVIDVSEPAAPVVVGSCSDVQRPGGLAVSGDILFVADMVRGLAVIDIADPATPTLVASLPLAGEFHGLALVGDLAFVPADEYGLHVVDVSDPWSPTLVGSIDFPGVVRDVAVVGDLAYLAAGSSGLRIVDVSNPASPVQVGQQQLYFGSSYALFALTVSVADHVACVGLGQAGLGLVDVAAPTVPTEVAIAEIPGSARASDRHGDLAWVAAYNGGLAAVDLGDLAVPAIVGRFGLLGDASDLAVSGGLVYVAGGAGWPEEKAARYVNHAGLFVVDMHQPASPTVIGYGAAWYQSPRVALDGERAFLSVPYGGVRIFDVVDPKSPLELGWIPNTAEGCEIAVVGDLLYNFQSGALVITDVGDPTQPEVVGSCDIAYYGNLTVDHGWVYSVSGYPGVQVYDARDPTQPIHVASLDLAGSAGTSAVCGGYLLIPNGPHGLRVVDVHDPLHPIARGACPLPGLATGVACRWPYAYVSTHDFSTEDGGVHAVDFSDPDAPVVAAATLVDFEAMAVALEGTRIYVAGTWSGVYAFEHDVVTGTLAPATVALQPNRPNPFNPRTTIAWWQPTAGPVELVVYDVAGRHVRTLVDGARPAGSRRVVWDGRDEEGREAPAGVYLYRLRAGGVEESRTMVLVR